MSTRRVSARNQRTTPTVGDWRRQYGWVNFACVLAETVESVLPLRLPIFSLFLALGLHMTWVVRRARRKKKLLANANVA